MEEVVSDDPIARLRAENREDIWGIRKRDREVLYKQRRLKLCEVEALVANITIEQFKEFVLQLKQKKPTLEVLKAVKNNCCTSDRTEAFFRVEGAFNALVRILIGKDACLQLEAAACLINLACGSHKAAYRIIKTAGPYLVSFIGSGSCYLQDQSAWACGNLASDCFECFSLLKAQGLVPTLIAALKSSSAEVIKSVVYALHACTKYMDGDLRLLAEPENLEGLVNILKEKNVESSIFSYTASTLSNIYYFVAHQDHRISDQETEVIVNCLCQSVSASRINLSIVLPLIRCLGFMTAQDVVCQYLSHHQEFSTCATQILNNDCHFLKVELLWVLTNIATQTEPGVPIELNSVLELIDSSVNPLDCSGVQVLYYLCCLAAKNKAAQEILFHPEVTQRIHRLQICGESTLEHAVETLLSLM